MGKVNSIWSYFARHKYLITIVLGVLMVGIIDENSVRKYVMLQMRLNEVRTELEAYEKQYEQDSTRLSALRVGKKGVERIARERYFMKRPNEDVYVLSTDKRYDEKAGVNGNK